MTAGRSMVIVDAGESLALTLSRKAFRRTEMSPCEPRSCDHGCAARRGALWGHGMRSCRDASSGEQRAIPKWRAMGIWMV